MMNKKVKILITIIGTIFLALIINSKSYAAYDYVPQKYVDIYNNDGPNGYDSYVYSSKEQSELKAQLKQFQQDKLGVESIGQRLMIGNKVLQDSEELYCVEHYRSLSTVRMFEVTNYIEIDGAIASIPGTSKSRENTSNIILAEILSRFENNYGAGYSVSPPEYSTTQLAIYMYLSTWLKYVPPGESLSNQEYFEIPDSIIVTEEVREEAMAKWPQAQKERWAEQSENGWNVVNAIVSEVGAAAKAGELSQYKTKVRMYFLEHTKGGGQQHLFIAIPEIPEETEIEIYKRDSETEAPLKMVGFIVKNVQTGEYISTTTIEGSNIYRVTGYSEDENDACTFITNSSGYIKIVGLEKGVYEFKEIINPNPEYEKNKGMQYYVLVSQGANNNAVLYNDKDYEEEEGEPGEGNVTISGNVWEDMFTGKSHKGNALKDSGESGVEGVIVYWKDKDGEIIAKTTTDSKGYYSMKTTVRYTIPVYNKVHGTHYHYKINESDKERVNNSYIEFEYNGLKYTTVAASSKIDPKTSIAKELVNTRNKLDNSFIEITSNEVKTGGYNLNYDTSGSNLAELIQNNTDFPVKANTQINGITDLWDEKEPTAWASYHRSCSCYYIVVYGVQIPVHKHAFQQYEVEWKIENMNLGLVKREQPDLAITSDINKVRVIMKGQEYTYYCHSRGISAPSDALFDYKVKFSGKYDQIYKRPINPADIGYINYPDNKNEMEVYVTYEINVKNQSNTLPVEVKEIVNYYDANYTPTDASLQKWSYKSKYGDDYNKNNGQYKAVYTQQLAGTIIQPQSTLKEPISVEYRVNDDVVQNVMKEDAFLHNVSEIYIYSSYYGGNTLCAENEKANQKAWYVKDKSQYAGIDKDSQPGSAIPGILESYEDDTDQAPVFALVKDPNYKIISGTVYEDLATDDNLNNGERIGNGVKDDDEKGVENVKVELLKVKDDGSTEVAYLYSSDGNTATRVRAETYTDENGHYAFGYNGEEGEPKPIYLSESGSEENYTRTGVTIDNYIIRYTYGNRTIDMNGETPDTSDGIDNVDSNSILKTPSTINGNAINARNYKSTIIASSPLKEVMKGSGYTIDADEWHLNHTDEYSIAVDNIEKRKAISSLTYDNFDTPINMTAYTEPFKVQIEYDTKSQESTLKQNVTNYQKVEAEDLVDAYGNKSKQYIDISVANIDGLEFTSEGNQTSGEFTEGKDYENDWEKFDFGIIERPREDIVIDKTIENFKITLANGQVLTEGKPYGEDNMPYVKALGTTNVTTRNRSIGANDKLLYIEMDSELIQGARIDIKYAITVTNNSEKDYEYDYDYSGKIEANNYIVKDNKIYYYYYGENKVNGTELKIIKSTVEWVVDYMDPELTCSVESILSDNNDTTITLEGVLSSISSNNDMIKRNNDLSIDDVNNVNGGTYTYEENKGTRVNGVPNWIQITPLLSGSGTVQKTAAARLREAGLISEATMNRLQEENYSIFITDYFYDVTSGTSKTLNLFASKLLANQATDYTYENHVEILQLNGKIARNIDSVDNGEQVTKQYKPGTYIPDLDRINVGTQAYMAGLENSGYSKWGKVNGTTIEHAGFHTQDDDMITIRITPPTGLENNMIIYISVGVVGLIVIAGGIYFIKKKVIG